MNRLAIGLFLTLAGTANAQSSLPLGLDDGTVLDATYYAADGPGPGLLFLNMCDPSRDQTEWTGAATALASKGYHVLTFDYRGFGKSGGERPTHLRSVNEAMPYWRDNWMSDVQTAYDTLISQTGVNKESMGIAGASCGVFLGLEFLLDNRNIKSFVSLGGPTDASQRERLQAVTDLPMLLITGNQRGPNEAQGTLEWSDDLFNASAHSDSRILKYKTATHGTLIFEHDPATEAMVVDWFTDTVAR